MNCLSTEFLVGFFIGVAVTLVIAIIAIVKIGLLLKSALKELKTKMETNIEFQKIFETKYFSKYMMWEQRALLNLLTSNKIDKFCVISKKKVFFYNLLILAPFVWFGLFYIFIKTNCG